ncbi:serine/threonine protein kinase [Saccharomyces pastorianus]|uniref:non-specific serine/threonine protein kinase n=1 Tax=Saccharomyces pastorianus TaxID=27292 RepID=A0A6C1E381_SACPS|nr:serine/threonine protein kinase [Saccharomyces pastorianus]
MGNRSLTEADHALLFEPSLPTAEDPTQTQHRLHPFVDGNGSGLKASPQGQFGDKALTSTHRFIPSANEDSSPRDMGLDPSMRRRRDEWADRGAAKIIKEVVDPTTGELTKHVVKMGIKDFKFGEQLGDGSYSSVVLATARDSGKKYAVKVLSKEYLIRQKKVKYVTVEKLALQKLNGTKGIIRLFFTFQDEASLYFLLEYAPHSDFLALIKKYGSLNEQCARYYASQIIDAVDSLHTIGIIHRDIKPENILLDKDMKVKLTDFGTAKILPEEPSNDADGKPYFDLNARSKSFVGTAEYVSPELLNDSYTDSRCDIWAFGCILFQMVAGKPPFKASNEYLTFQKVMKVQYAFTAGFPQIIKDLVKKLLVKEPNDRLTIEQIKAHIFFQSVNFDNGSVWDDDPPEIQPYKISAEALKPLPKVPEPDATAKLANLQLAYNSHAETTPQTSAATCQDRSAISMTAATAAFNKDCTGQLKSGYNSNAFVRSSSSSTDREKAHKKTTNIHASRSSPSITSVSKGKEPRSRSADNFWSSYLKNLDEHVLLVKDIELSVEATESSAVDLETLAPDYKSPCDIDSPTESADKFYKRILVITNLGRGLIFAKKSPKMRKEREFELQFELKLNQVEKINLINDQMLQIEGPKTVFMACKDRAVLIEVWKLMKSEICAKPKVASSKLEHKMFDKFISQKVKKTKGKNQVPHVPESSRLVNGLPGSCMTKAPEGGGSNLKRPASLQTRSSSNYSKLLARSTEMRKNMTRTNEK